MRTPMAIVYMTNPLKAPGATPPVDAGSAAPDQMSEAEFLEWIKAGRQSAQRIAREMLGLESDPAPPQVSAEIPEPPHED
jgi:hypothetical protein